jgi:hypothetical protein
MSHQNNGRFINMHALVCEIDCLPD